MAKAKFILSLAIELEDASRELELAAECSAANFLEVLEAKLDQHIEELRKKHPDCNFTIGRGNDGEEWKD